MYYDNQEKIGCQDLNDRADWGRKKVSWQECIKLSGCRG